MPLMTNVRRWHIDDANGLTLCRVASDAVHHVHDLYSLERLRPFRQCPTCRFIAHQRLRGSRCTGKDKST